MIKECKSILFKMGIQVGVSPKLISLRLLSKADKQDMLAGLLPLESLITHVKVWAQNGCPNYVNVK